MKGGFLSILKPPGMSSHDVINICRKTLGIKRIGHAGTLDPSAAGVLPVGVGRAARLLEYLDMASKSYRAEVILGYSTTTDDDTGEVLEKEDCFSFPVPDKERIGNLLSSFIGEIEQTPPAYSAIKVGGRRACDRIRSGEEIRLAKRKVTILSMHLVSDVSARFIIDIECSSGTYIRSLVRSIGKALDMPATMGFLLRTRVGSFHIREALSLEELQRYGSEALAAPERYLSHLPRYELPSDRILPFCNGLPTHDEHHVHQGIHAVFHEDTFLGIGRFRSEDSSIVPLKVFGQEADG